MLSKRKHQWVHLIFILLAITLVVYFICCLFSRYTSERINDYYHFYFAAQAITEGQDLYRSGMGGYVYPPFFAFLLTPLAYLSYKTGDIVWLFINTLIFLTALFFGVHAFISRLQLKLDGWQIFQIGLLAAMVTYVQILTVLRAGQSDALVLLGLVLGLFFLDRKPFLAGLIWGITGLIKYQALLFLPLLLFRKRWSEAIGLLVGAAFAALLPAIAVGWERNLHYLCIAVKGLFLMKGITHNTSVVHFAAVPSITWLDNISITSALTRFFENFEILKIYVVLPLTALALILLFTIVWIYRKQGFSFFKNTPDYLFKMEWCVWLMLILMFSPQCLRRHTVLLLCVHLPMAMMIMTKPLRTSFGLLIFLGCSLFAFNYQTYVWSYIGAPMWVLLFLMLYFVKASLSFYKEKRIMDSPLEPAPENGFQSLPKSYS